MKRFLWFLSIYFVLFLAGVAQAQVQRYRIPAGNYKLQPGQQLIKAFCLDGVSRPPAEVSNLLKGASNSLWISRTNNGEKAPPISIHKAIKQNIIEIRGNGTTNNVLLELKIAPKDGESYDLISDISGYAIVGENNEEILDIIKELPPVGETMHKFIKFEKAATALKDVIKYEMPDKVPIIRFVEENVQVGLRNKSTDETNELLENAYAYLHEKILHGYSPERRLENFSWDTHKLLSKNEISKLRNAGIDIAISYTDEFREQWTEVKYAFSEYNRIIGDKKITQPIHTSDWRTNLTEKIQENLPIFNIEDDSSIPREALELWLGKRLLTKDFDFLSKYGHITIANKSFREIENAALLRLQEEGLIVNSLNSSQRISREQLVTGNIALNLESKLTLIEDSFLQDGFFGYDSAEAKAVLLALKSSGAIEYKSFSAAFSKPSAKPMYLIVIAPRSSEAKKEEWFELWGNQNPNVLNSNFAPLRHRNDCDFADSIDSLDKAIDKARKNGKQIAFFHHNPKESRQSQLSRLLNFNVLIQLALVPKETQSFRCSSLSDFLGESSGTVCDLNVKHAVKSFIKVLDNKEKNFAACYCKSLDNERVLGLFVRTLAGAIIYDILFDDTM